MTAYLKWQGMTDAELSLYHGAEAVSGLAAIVIVPRLLNRSGPVLYCAALSEYGRAYPGLLNTALVMLARSWQYCGSFTYQGSPNLQSLWMQACSLCIIAVTMQ